MRQLSDAQYADELEEFMKGARGAQVIVDPSAASFKAEMIQRGIWHTDADNEVLDGIRMVSTMLSRGLLKIHKDCTNLITQMQTYAWDEKKGQRGLEEPVKSNDHGPDAARYCVKTKIAAWRLAA
jgi:phage terminase large subunit